MDKDTRALARNSIGATFLTALIVSCSGGAPAPAPQPAPDFNPTGAVAQYSFADSEGRLIDTESNYQDQSDHTITRDAQINISAQLFGRDIVHGNQRGRLEITNGTVDNNQSPLINGVQGRFIATMGGKNMPLAGNSRFSAAFSGDDIAKLAPEGGWVDVEIGFEIMDDWYGRMLVQLNGFTVRPEDQPVVRNGGGRAWQGWTVLGVLGVLAAIFPCPDDYEHYRFRVAPGTVPPVTTTHTLVTSITPATTTITINETVQFSDSVWFDGIVVNGASCTWSVVSGSGTINSSSGLYTATSQTGTTTIKVVCAYNGLTATDTATVIVNAPVTPPGLTLDGKPFDPALLNKVLTPENATIDVLTKDTQQLGPVLSYGNQENTIDKRWYYIESWEAGAGAPTGSISIGGLWRGVISGNGTFDPGVWVVILNEPINTRVYVTTEITVTGN